MAYILRLRSATPPRTKYLEYSTTSVYHALLRNHFRLRPTLHALFCLPVLSARRHYKLCQGTTECQQTRIGETNYQVTCWVDPILNVSSACTSCLRLIALAQHIHSPYGHERGEHLGQVLVRYLTQLQKNILIDDNGNARLTDFGLGCILQTSGYTRTTPSGTVRWMARELVATSETGEEQADPQPTMEADVWAFALTVIEVGYLSLSRLPSLAS